jgi:hypothetical protein
MLPAPLWSRFPQPPLNVNRLSLPVNGALGDGTFAGTLLVQRFVPQDGGIAAVGFVTGTLRTNTGATSLARTLRMPALVTVSHSPAVQVDLGPVSVDVLWWRMDFGRIVLDVGAESGDGSVELLRRELAAAEGEPSRVARVLNGLIEPAK